jgi:hypothetical protein
MSAPLTDLKGPVGPANFTRPKHKRTVTGFGPGDIKSVEASIPEPQRAAWKKFVSSIASLRRRWGSDTDYLIDSQALFYPRRL